MARNYGRFTTTIWRDPDFTGLCRNEQAVYFMLCTQPEVTAAGTLPLTLRRWANTATDETVDTLRDHLTALEKAGHVLLDEDTEELLIVKFMKFDQGWYNEKRWPVVAAAVDATASVHIRDAAVDEIVRLRASRTLPDPLSTHVDKWLSRKASHRASRGESGFDRSGLTKVSTVPTPGTATLEGEPSPQADDPLSPFCPEHQPDGTLDKCGRCATRRESLTNRNRLALDAEVEKRKAAKLAIDSCELCDDKGVRLHPVSRMPLGRCNHRELAVAAS